MRNVEGRGAGMMSKVGKGRERSGYDVQSKGGACVWLRGADRDEGCGRERSGYDVESKEGEGAERARCPQ